MVTVYVVVILGYVLLVKYEMEEAPSACLSLDRLINFWEEGGI